MKAQLDPPLTSFLNEGLIKVGTKLCIYGAELVGSDEGCAPLEVMIHFDYIVICEIT